MDSEGNVIHGHDANGKPVYSYDEFGRPVYTAGGDAETSDEDGETNFGPLPELYDKKGKRIVDHTPE